jgi:hypothetical protein
LRRWISAHPRPSRVVPAQWATSNDDVKARRQSTNNIKQPRFLALLCGILAGAMTPPTSPACQESSAVPGSKNGTAVRGELLHRLLLNI